MLTTFAGQLGQFLERERVEAALADSQSQTRRILTTAHDAFVAMDRDGVITDWNPRARVTFGWTREEALGRDLAETIIPKRFREHHRQGLERFLSGGGGPVLDRLIELAGLHRDGREFPVELTISAIESESGFSFYAFLRDISERKLTEKNLAGVQLELESQNEALAERVRERTRSSRRPVSTSSTGWPSPPSTETTTPRSTPAGSAARQGSSPTSSASAPRCESS